MSLLSPSDQNRLRDSFAAIKNGVRLLFFTQTLDCETCGQTRRILDELPPLSDKVTIEEVNLILEGDKAKQLGIDRAPSIAVMYEDRDGSVKDSRIRFAGAPAGYEFMSLVHAVLLAGGGASGLTEKNRARLETIESPITMQVFTTPT